MVGWEDLISNAVLIAVIGATAGSIIGFVYTWCLLSKHVAYAISQIEKDAPLDAMERAAAIEDIKGRRLDTCLAVAPLMAIAGAVIPLVAYLLVTLLAL